MSPCIIKRATFRCAASSSHRSVALPRVHAASAVVAFYPTAPLRHKTTHDHQKTIDKDAIAAIARSTAKTRLT